jgi:hypothetical protein
MLAIVWVALAVLGGVQMVGVLTGKTPDVVTEFIGIILGLLLAFGALNFEVAAGGGTIVTQTKPELSLVGLTILVTNSILLFTSSVESLAPTNIFGSR